MSANIKMERAVHNPGIWDNICDFGKKLGGTPKTAQLLLGDPDLLAIVPKTCSVEPITEVAMPGRTFHIINDPVLQKEIMRCPRNDKEGMFFSPDEELRIIQLFKTVFNDMELDRNDLIFTCEKEQAELFHTFFRKVLSNKIIDQLRDSISAIVNKTLNNGLKGDLYQTCKVYASSVISEIFLDYRGDSEEITHAVSKLLSESIKGITLTGRLKMLAVETGLATSEPTLDALKVLKTAASEACEKAQNSEGSPSIIKEMLDFEYAGKKAFSEKQVQIMALTLLIAGQDTAATSLYYLLIKLAQHPEYAEGIRQDSDQFMRCFVEALRMCPPAYFVYRQPADAVSITIDDRNYHIGKTDFIETCPYLTARHPSIAGDNPDEFDPARHDKIPSRLTGLPWLPFGTGLNKCVGWYLAKTEVELFVRELLQRFELSTEFEGEPRKKGKFTTVIADEIDIELKARRPSPEEVHQSKK
ncbi:MAG: cytochrome P450 [Chlamydiales bacterium]|nr:cytochrome P450 [Chlamydiia bacterium]MCP5506805.1 cytochrome P450 [Chlamydiales bacterium]